MEQKPFPGRLNGNRIFLERHSLSLAPQMFALIDKNREHLQGMPWIHQTLKEDNSRGWIELTLVEWDNLSLFDYGIYLPASAGRAGAAAGAEAEAAAAAAGATYIGSFGVHSINWEFKNCELGYWIGKEFEGQGYISEALKAVEGQCFKAGFHRVEIRCDSRNERSAQVALKNNYKFEGELREDSLIFGEYRNTKVFGKLRREWIRV